jgi:type II secretory pathway pseudopilin PulG
MSGFSFQRFKKRTSALTLLEVIFALSLIGIAASSTLWGLTQMNNQAAISRCYTGAATAAQNQIDLILSDGPFNPQKSQVPSELKLGTQSVSNVPVYQDPVSGVIVSGKMSTTVTDISVTYGSWNMLMSMYQATVTVTYTFRNRSYAVTMSTIRCSDV